DPLGRRGCRCAAFAAVLDHGADDELRRGLRIVRGTIAAPPRLVLFTLVAGERDDLLGGAGLACDRHREVAEDAVGGAEGVMRPLEEALLDDLEIRRVEAGDRPR